MRYFHGSYDYIDPQTMLSGRGENYEDNYKAADFYVVLEHYRPKSMLAHKDSVFMVESPEEIDNVGGATDWCSELNPIGEVSRHDINWSSAISCLISEGHPVESKEVAGAARAYWAGEEHPALLPVWEYLTTQAVVLRCEPFEDFEVEASAASPEF